MQKMMPSTALLVYLIIASVAMTSVVHAQIEEVIVTAQKREQNLQDVPISVSVISGSELENQAIPNFEDLASTMPNFNVSKNAIQDTVSIRGINSDSQAGGEQSVGTYVDGIFRGRGVQSRFAFMDVERIEVLRGPQGTLFGKNTIAGALNITSARPTDVFEASISGMYEFKHQESEIQAFVSGPLSDNVTGRVAVLWRDMEDGWVDNIGYDEDMPSSEEHAVRGTLEWAASEKLSFTGRLEHGEFDIVGAPYDFVKIGPSLAGAVAAFGIPGVAAGFDGVNNITNAFNPLFPLVPNLDAIDLDTAYFMEGDSDQVTLQADFDLEAGLLTALYGYSSYDFLRGQDADYGPLPVVSFTDSEDFEQNSLELRFTSNSDGNLNYILGAYLQSTDLATWGDTSMNFSFLNIMLGGGTPMGPPTSNPARINTLDQESDTWALFAQMTYQVSEKWSVTAGLRYESEKKDALQSAHIFDATTGGAATPPPSPPNPPANIMWWALPTEVVEHDYTLSRSENSWSPQLQVQWNATEDVNLYASWSQGHKGGGFNSMAFGLNPFDPTDDTGAEYEDEVADSIEIGTKMTLLDGAARLNVGYFNMRFDDLQTTSFTGSTGFIVTNAAEADIQGIEIDGIWAVTEQWTLQGNFGWVDFEFVDYPTAGCTSDQIALYPNAAACSAAGGNDLSGQTNQDTPEITAAFSVLYEPRSRYFKALRVGANYSGEYFATPDLDPATIQSSFWKLNAMATFGPEEGNWEISLIGKNLTDEMTFMYANDVPLFAGSHFAGWQRPRTIAIRFRAIF